MGPGEQAGAEGIAPPQPEEPRGERGRAAVLAPSLPPPPAAAPAPGTGTRTAGTPGSHGRDPGAGGGQSPSEPPGTARTPGSHGRDPGAAGGQSPSERPGPAARPALSRGKLPPTSRYRVKLLSLPLISLPKPPREGCWEGDTDTFISQFFFFGQEMCVERGVEIVNFIDYLQTVQSIFKLS